MGQRQEENGCLKCCLGTLLAKISLQRERRQAQESTEMDLMEVDFEGVHILHQVQDRIQWRGLANMAMKFRVAQNRRMSRVAKGNSASSSSSYFKIIRARYPQ
jgi:Cu/Ag efflux protein CusF